MSHKVDHLPENFLVGNFIAGLKDEVRLDVRVKEPKNLSEAISVAHLIEERKLLQRNRSSSFRPAGYASQYRPLQQSTVVPSQPRSMVGLLGPPPQQRARK